MVFAQLPNSVIYSAEIENPFDTVWRVSKIQFLSAQNAKGYNNQPYFISEKEILISSNKGDPSQTDIYYYDLKNKVEKQITHTTGHEYSPRVSPLYPGDLTVVFVPKDESNKQHLIRFSQEQADAIEAPVNLLDERTGKIGYYRHLHDKKWVCFLVDSPNVMAICEEGKVAKKIFAAEIGRSFEVVNKNEIVFVHKILTDKWLLKKYNVNTGKAEIIIQMPNGIEDFALLPNGAVICATDSKILLARQGKTNWNEVINFSSLGIKNINRISFLGKTMVFVSMLK